MIWLSVIALALIVLVAGFALFGLRGGQLLALAATMALGLALFAAQARPDLPGAPKAEVATADEGNEQLIAMRRVVMGTAERPPSRGLLTADAFARRGQYDRAAVMLRGAVRENPNDAESWVAMGNALVEHTGGRLTEPALYAYRRGAQADPPTLASGFFIGAALIRQGRLVEAREVWADALERAPEDVPFRDGLSQRLDALDQLIARVAELQAAESPER